MHSSRVAATVGDLRDHGLPALGYGKLPDQGCRQIRLTIRYINQINQFKSDMEFCQINQFKYNVCTSDISEWRAATLDTPDYPYVPAPERVALPETLQCYRGQRS
jgi:hypothetical protein